MTRTSEYYRGLEDGYIDCPPDYSQSDGERFRDYCAGYRLGKAERETDAKTTPTEEA